MVLTDLVLLNGNVVRINCHAEKFKKLHNSLQCNLHIAMDAIFSVYQKLKALLNTIDASKQIVWNNFLYVCSHMNLTYYLQTLAVLRKKLHSLMVFAGMLCYHLSPDVYSWLAHLDVEVALQCQCHSLNVFLQRVVYNCHRPVIPSCSLLSYSCLYPESIC